MEKLKLNLEKKGIYEIEVNDNGDVITIDTEDIETPLKYQKMYEDCMKIVHNMEKKDKEISKMEEVDKGIITNKEEELLKAMRKCCQDIRKVIDGFFGEGASQKIYGDRNYPDMFADLMDALMPHLERIGLETKDAREAIAEKYSDKDEDTI